jgi:hypothetical protein
MRKNLLTRIGETIDQYQAEQRQHSYLEKVPIPRHSQRRLPSVLKWFLPNGGTVLLILLLIATQSLWAQSLPGPTSTSTSTISYQGRLADADGNPLTGVYNMEFRIYSHPTAGEPLWTEYWTGGNSVQISDGLFNVMLGSINTSLVSAIHGNNELYVGITVGSDTEMTPRIQLGSVPFSMQALTVPDYSITSVKLVEGSVTSEKQTITSYYRQDSSYVETVGTTGTIISEFVINDVPAGNISIVCTFIASAPDGEITPGSIILKLPQGTVIAAIPTHMIRPPGGEYTIHGQISNFLGGQFIFQIYSQTEINRRITFGATNGDWRFGRKCSVVAGL